MVTVTFTNKSDVYGTSSAKQDYPNWEIATVEIFTILSEMPDASLVPFVAEWMRHDGSTPFEVEMLCGCGGVCGLEKFVSYSRS